MALLFLLQPLLRKFVLGWLWGMRFVRPLLRVLRYRWLREWMLWRRRLRNLELRCVRFRLRAGLCAQLWLLERLRFIRTRVWCDDDSGSWRAAQADARR
ncbi:MAG TPA: hypothetical protein VEI07_12790 [Planctomycetaceae bacterium]|nr:hypothetical protein [Planctomycetaceae bacterium]